MVRNFVFQEIAQGIRIVNSTTSADDIKSSWRAYLSDIVDECFPHGSGIDNGNSIDFDKSSSDRIVINSSFHCMDENGFYCGWYDFSVTVKPSLQFRFDMKIQGRNSCLDRNNLKEYIYEIYEYALGQIMPDDLSIVEYL